MKVLFETKDRTDGVVYITGMQIVESHGNRRTGRKTFEGNIYFVDARDEISDERYESLRFRAEYFEGIFRIRAVPKRAVERFNFHKEEQFHKEAVKYIRNGILQYRPYLRMR